MRSSTFYTLKHVLFHLRLVASYADYNFMFASNLAIVFAPVLFPLSIQELINKSNYATQTIEYLINNYTSVFSPDTNRGDGAYMEPETYQMPSSRAPVHKNQN